MIIFRYFYQFIIQKPRMYNYIDQNYEKALQKIQKTSIIGGEKNTGKFVRTKKRFSISKTIWKT